MPVVLAALVLTVFFVPESRAAVARRIDPVGQVLVIVFLVGLTYGIIEGRVGGLGFAADRRLLRGRRRCR